MEEYQQRILDEKKALDEKRVKLTDFLGCTASAQIEPEARGLLEQQSEAMETYSEILSRRLQLMGIVEV